MITRREFATTTCATVIWYGFAGRLPGEARETNNSGCQKQLCNFLPPFATLVLPTRNIPSGPLWGPKYCTFEARKAARNRARRDRNDSKFTRRSPPDRPAEG